MAAGPPLGAPREASAAAGSWGQGRPGRVRFRVVGVSVGPQEWSGAFLAIVAFGLAAAFGWSLGSLVAVLLAAAVFGLANRRLARTGVSLWRGLCLTAAWNPTGESWIGQLIVLPRLAFTSLFALVEPALRGRERR